MAYFEAKVHQIRFRLGSAPNHAGGACGAIPDPVAGFMGFTSKGGEGIGYRRQKGEERKKEKRRK